MTHLEESDSETECRVVTRAEGEAGRGNLCLMGTEFQCGKMKKFWR